MQHELLERTLPTLDYPTNERQERNRLSQIDADFKVLYIFLCMNLLWQILLLIMLGSG